MSEFLCLWLYHRLSIAATKIKRMSSLMFIVKCVVAMIEVEDLISISRKNKVRILACPFMKAFSYSLVAVSVSWWIKEVGLDGRSCCLTGCSWRRTLFFPPLFMRVSDYLLEEIDFLSLTEGSRENASYSNGSWKLCFSNYKFAFRRKTLQSWVLVVSQDLVFLNLDLS